MGTDTRCRICGMGLNGGRTICSFCTIKRRKQRLELACQILVGIGMIGIFVTGWVAHSAQEAAAFNRVTGKHVSTWDAMFVDLRVQETVK